MQDVSALVQDLVSSVRQQPQPYDQLLETWKTSCPRLEVWETAWDEGRLVSRLENGVAIVHAA